MSADPAENEMKKRLLALQSMDLKELHLLWNRYFETPPPSLGKTLFFRRRLAYRIQEEFYGGISEETRKRLECAVQNFPQRRNGGWIPGTRFLRKWKGQTYIVQVHENGFEFQGEIFQSLSRIAKAITGSARNGRKFFGLK